MKEDHGPMSGEDVVKALRDPNWTAEQHDPKAVYRTRPVALYEAAADLIERQAKALGPFAQWAADSDEGYTQRLPDSTPANVLTVTLGDMRAARAALQEG